ncbi:MAG TPA: O-antigen ligase family protein [Fimbriimonas sp.]
MEERPCEEPGGRVLNDPRGCARAVPPDTAAIRKLLWAYVALVFLEGPLRKWFLPGLSQPLLVARDPIVLALLYLAWKRRLFVGTRFMEFVGWLAFASVAASLLVRDGFLTTAYGFRSNFLHLPVILLMARVFERRDLLLFARCALAFALPHGLLMMAQFFSPPGAFLNSGADDAFTQIGLGDGYIRPAGIFSYNTGASAYHAIVLALCLAPLGGRGSHYGLLRAFGYAGTGLATVFSGSRSAWMAFLAVSVVYLSASILWSSAQLARKAPALMALLVFLPIALAFPSVSTALEVFVSHRLANDSTQTELLPRLIGLFTRPFETMWDFPLLGYGLGVGTSAGAALSGIGSLFYYGDAETEFTRHFLESGPLLGGMFVALRIGGAFHLLKRCLKTAHRSDLTALLLWASVAPSLVAGNLGQSTAAAFCVLVSGLALLACRHAEEPEPRAAPALPGGRQILAEARI